MGNIREVLNPDKTVEQGIQRLDDVTRAAREGSLDLSAPVRETILFISATTVYTPYGELTRRSRKAVRDEFINAQRARV